jgi:anti-sigma factor RsiW
MDSSLINSANAEDDPLVAYLDGELDAAETARIEEQLASDAAMRARLQQLQRTWDLLDSLPVLRTGDAFTKSTMELAVQQVRRDRDRRRSWLMRWAPGLALCAVMILASAAAYQATRYVREAENRELVRDLRIIENIDLYRSMDRTIDQLEFLKRLDESKLFPPREVAHE